MNGSQRTQPLVTVVLPCLNEAQSIVACIEQARQGLQGAGLLGEVLVVDNGSTDGTPDLATAAGVRVIHEPERGVGSAVMRGVAEAAGDIIVMADADCTYELTRLGALVEPIIRDEADLVIGYRETTADESTPWTHHRLGTPLLSWINRMAAPGLRVRDSQSGFRAFRRSEALGLRLRTPGFEHCSEMLVRFAAHGYRIHEVSTLYRSRVGESKLSAFRDGLLHLRILVLLSPELLLRLPAIALVLSGLAIEAFMLAWPNKSPVGGTDWQPVFLSTILLVLGAVSWLASVTVRYASPLARARVDAAVNGDKLRSALRRATAGGFVVFAFGAGSELALALLPATAVAPPNRRLALNSFAASSVLVGAVVAVASAIALHADWQRRYLASDGESGKPAEENNPKQSV